MSTTTTPYAVPTDRDSWDDTVRDAAVTVYVAGDKKAKAAIRTAWTRAMEAAIDDTDITAARFAKAMLKEHLVTRTGPAAPKVSPADAYVRRITALVRAADTLAESYGSKFGDEALTQLRDRLTAEADTYRDHTDTDTMATKLAVVSVRRSGPNRSIIGHIQDVLDAAPDGAVLTAAQIAAAASVGYPEADASPGAIGAAWDRDSTVIDGVAKVKDSHGTKAFKLDSTVTASDTSATSTATASDSADIAADLNGSVA